MQTCGNWIIFIALLAFEQGVRKEAHLLSFPRKGTHCRLPLAYLAQFIGLSSRIDMLRVRNTVISFVVFSHVEITHDKVVLVSCTDDKCGYDEKRPEKRRKRGQRKV
jgi:hypothetical protein